MNHVKPYNSLCLENVFGTIEIIKMCLIKGKLLIINVIPHYWYNYIFRIEAQVGIYFYHVGWDWFERTLSSQTITVSHNSLNHHFKFVYDLLKLCFKADKNRIWAIKIYCRIMCEWSNSQTWPQCSNHSFDNDRLALSNWYNIQYYYI